MINANDEFRCDCIAMTRSIKDKLDAEFATMKVGEVSLYLEKSALEFREDLSRIRVAKKKLDAINSLIGICKGSTLTLDDIKTERIKRQ